jgi:hypothetical protein
MWRSTAPKDYRYELRAFSFTTADETDTIVVNVRNNQTVAMKYKLNDQTPQNPFFQDYSTIDKVFRESRRVAQTKPYKLHITYDPTYGYPRSISYDYDLNTFDDEYSITLSTLQPLNP